MQKDTPTMFTGSSSCFVCFAMNRRTFDIKNTRLELAYEKITDNKIHGDTCKLCFICHKRLQQCHQLLRVATQCQKLREKLQDVKVQSKHETNAQSSTTETQIDNTKLLLNGESSNGHSKVRHTEDNNKDVQNDVITILSSDSENDIEVNNVQHKQNICNANRDISKNQNKKEFGSTTFKMKNLVFNKILSYSKDKTLMYSSDKCPYKVNIESILSNHLQDFASKHKKVMLKETHAGDKPFTCQICQHTFSWKRTLNAHIRTHIEKPFTCDICHNKFSQLSSLNMHIRTHTGEKPFECEVCGRKFSQSRFLNVHKNTHVSDKPFSCDVCGRGFVLKNNLTVHRRTHESDNPFKCDICYKIFLNNSNFLAHKRIHTGERPFSCDICQRKFALRGALTAHMNRHNRCL